MQNLTIITLFLSLVSCVNASTARDKIDRHPSQHMSTIKPNVLKDFTSDGCSSPSPYIKYPFQDSYELCCVAHDIHYWKGGTYQQRKKADEELRICVEEQGHENTAHLVYLGVRIGGNDSLPTPWRWGYGWERDRGEHPHNSDELELIAKQTESIPLDLREIRPVKPRTPIVIPTSITGDHCKDTVVNYLETKLRMTVSTFSPADLFKPLLPHINHGPGKRTLAVYTKECAQGPIRFTFAVPSRRACNVNSASSLEALLIHMENVELPLGCVPLTE